MTAPPPDAATTGPARPWYAQPWVVFGALALVIVLTVLLTPAEGRTGDGRLTTLSRNPNGARAFADVAQRLGWRVVRDSSVPTRAPLPADRVYAVLAPPEPLTGREYGRLLDAVRRGAGLLVVHPGKGSAIADSLGIDLSSEGARMRVQPGAASCPEKEPRYAIDWPGGDVWSLWLVPRRPLGDTVQFLPVGRMFTPEERRSNGRGQVVVEEEPDETPTAVADEDADAEAADAEAADAEAGDTAATATARPDTSTVSGRVSRALRQRIVVPAAIGMPVGRGRVVVLADPDWLRNDVQRVCRWHAAVTSVRMLEWLAAGGTPRTLVFDEWHQGRGIHPSAMQALTAFVAGDPRGRAVAQGLVAALLLLAAMAARPLVPELRSRVERRSPFEHVGALARAYEEIGATRVVARRLVRGLRRRLGAAPGVRDEDTFLALLEARHPALAGDIALVRAALDAKSSAAQLLDVGRAVARIEKTVVRS